MSRWVEYNPSPLHKRVGDCQIRALCKALNKSWDEVFNLVADEAFRQKDVISANAVWGQVLADHGFKRYDLTYPADLHKFCCNFPEGVYVVCLDEHVVTVVDGFYYDTWQSGKRKVLHYWTRCLTILQIWSIVKLKKAIEKVGQDYELKLDYLEIGEYTDKDHIGAPMFFRPVLNGSKYESKLVINNACEFWTDETVRQGIFDLDEIQAKSIEDVVYHELAHIMTFQSCKIPEDYYRMEYEVRCKAGTGISEYATRRQDGAEDIAEAFVKKCQGYAVNMRADYLLQKYIEIWRK